MLDKAKRTLLAEKKAKRDRDHVQPNNDPTTMVMEIRMRKIATRGGSYGMRISTVSHSPPPSGEALQCDPPTAEGGRYCHDQGEEGRQAVQIHVLGLSQEQRQ